MSITVDPKLFERDMAVHWVVSPLVPERYQDIILPLVFQGRTYFVMARGLVLPWPIAQHEMLKLDGHTGEFGSRYTMERHAEHFELHGVINGETMDYTVDMTGDAWRVAGDTGKYRSAFVVTLLPDGFKVAGDTGHYTSDYTVQLTENGLSVAGTKEGEQCHYTIEKHENVVTHKGQLGPGFGNFTVTEREDGHIIVDGMVFDKPVHLDIHETDDAIAVVGFTPWGKSEFSVHPVENGCEVKGRADKGRVAYTVVRSALQGVEVEQAAPADVQTEVEEKPAPAESVAEEKTDKTADAPTEVMPAVDAKVEEEEVKTEKYEPSKEPSAAE